MQSVSLSLREHVGCCQCQLWLAFALWTALEPVAMPSAPQHHQAHVHAQAVKLWCGYHSHQAPRQSCFWIWGSSHNQAVLTVASTGRCEWTVSCGLRLRLRSAWHCCMHAWCKSSGACGDTACMRCGSACFFSLAMAKLSSTI